MEKGLWLILSKAVCKVRAGDFSLDDAPWLGRPVEADSNQIKMLTDNNQCSTTWDNRHTMSKSIKLLVKMKNVSFILQKEPDFLANPKQHAY